MRSTLLTSGRCTDGRQRPRLHGSTTIGWIVLDCFEDGEQIAQLELTPEQAIDIAAEILVHALMAQRKRAVAKPKLKVVDGVHDRRRRLNEG